MFNKKKKDTYFDSEDQNNTDKKKKQSKAEYNVYVLVRRGGAPKLIKKFAAVRVREEDDVVYLKSVKKKIDFLEVFPDQITDFKNYTENEVDESIIRVTEDLKRERMNDTEEINDKDLEHELRMLHAKKRTFKYDNHASYEFLDEDNKAAFLFLRKGSSFLPFKWDLEDATIFLPTDNRKKSASLALRNKEEKYTTKKIMEAGALFMLIIGLIMCCAAGFAYYKINQSHDAFLEQYDKSEIAAAQRASLEVANQCAAISQKVAQSALNVVNEAEEKINRNQTVIEGIIPE